jgi:hypothetical protein
LNFYALAFVDCERLPNFLVDFLEAAWYIVCERLPKVVGSLKPAEAAPCGQRDR